MPDLIETLKDCIDKQLIEVTFRKKDGEIRAMTCTTNLDLIPPSAWPKNKVAISEATKERTMRVYDLNVQGWRSFVLDNVQNVKLL
jgi:hypothetical protein